MALGVGHRDHRFFQVHLRLYGGRIWLPGSGEVDDWPALSHGQSFPPTARIHVVEGRVSWAAPNFADFSWAPRGLRAWDLYRRVAHLRCRRGRGSITFYYDGIEIYQDTSGITF